MDKDPHLMTEEEREKFAYMITENVDVALRTFAELALPPGMQYVFVFGFKDKVGAMVSNIEDEKREVIIQFLMDGQKRLKQ